ncbi:Nucleic acid-binding, OB-fold, partial [Sesbania bispinosa]
GGRIEATISKQHMNKFAHALVEGQIYRITNFGLLRNSGKSRVVVHEFKFIFNATTILSPCQNVSIPSSGFALMKTDEIKRTRGRSDYLL